MKDQIVEFHMYRNMYSVSAIAAYIQAVLHPPLTFINAI